MREVDEMLTEREAEHKYTHPTSLPTVGGDSDLGGQSYGCVAGGKHIR